MSRSREHNQTPFDAVFFSRRREHLATEQNRRQTAEAIIQRAKGGGIRPGDFPSVRDVDRDVENLARHAQTWAETACAIGGSRPALPAVVKSVLRNTFLVCREEVQACLDRKLESLSEFLGKNEPIALSGLSGGDSMNLDTQYVLYECLCRNFRDIVPTDPGRMEDLAGMVHQRSGGAADGDLAGDVIYGDAWPAFDNLMKKYIMAFVEVGKTPNSPARRKGHRTFELTKAICLFVFHRPVLFVARHLEYFV